MFFLKNCDLLIETLLITTLIMLEIFNHAAISGKVVQHNLVAKCCQQDSELSTKYRLHYSILSRRKLLPLVGGKLAWNGNSTMQLGALPKFKHGIVYCNGLYQNLTVQVDLRLYHNFPKKYLEYLIIQRYSFQCLSWFLNWQSFDFSSTDPTFLQLSFILLFEKS